MGGVGGCRDPALALKLEMGKEAWKKAVKAQKAGPVARSPPRRPRCPTPRPS